nr:retrovirus-related Pol polyprotein from transposon TNT 1-94 [Tanacetum cinerariifolium]
MLDRIDFASWQQRIRLYCRGKENGVNILKSINEGPYQIGTVRETLAESTEGAPQFGPERPRVYSNLTPEEKDRFAKLINDMRNIKMTMFRRQLNSNFVNNMLPKWGRFVMASSTQVPPPLADSSSPAEDLIENLTNTLALLTQSYITFLPQTNNQLRTSSNAKNQATVQDGRVVVQNVQRRPNRGQGMNPRGRSAVGYGGAQNRVGNVNPGQARPVKCYNCNGTRKRSSFGRRTVAADDCDAFDSDVDEAPTAQTMFMANLSSADPVTDEAGPSYDWDILSEVPDYEHYQDAACAHHEGHVTHDSVQLDHVVDSHADYTSDSNMIPYDQVAIGYKNPLCLNRAKQVQPALYNGHEIIKDNHTSAIVHNVEDTLEIAEITMKKINDKMNDPECVLKQLTPEQIFWSNDLMKLKSEALKERTKVSRPIKALTVYPPNTPATLVPKVLPIKSQVKIHIFTLIQLFSKFDKTCKKRITPTGLTEEERGFKQTKECYLKEVIPFLKTLKYNFNGIQKALTNEIKEIKEVFEELEVEVAQYVVDRKHDAIERKNLLIANDNLIFECLSQEVFFVATNSELNVARFTEMHVANTTVEARCLALEAELANLRDMNNHDNQKELINHFSKLETTDSQITKLTDQVTNLQAQKDMFRAENDKIKQHYKDLYDSIKITRAKHIEQVTKLTTKNVNLKTSVNYLRHLKESVETIRDIIEEAKVVRPLDRSIVSACRYTKHSQELLEYAIGTCPQGSQQRAKQLAYIPLIRKKQLTIAKPFDKSDSTTHRHVVTVKSQRTNVPVPPSIGVNSCPNAIRSQPKSHVKPNRISPAKGVNKIPVEDQARTNKPHLRTSNRVDSSSRLKRNVVHIVLWYLDSGCSKYMTGDRSRLMNFVKKFIGTIKFGNDHFGAIMGYGDYVIGDSVISRVYYVEGLGHNLFSVGQFCDSDLEVAFRKHSCYVRDTDGVELIKGSRGSNLYTISVKDMMKSSPICLLSKASKNKSWLWHRRLNHLKFGTINDLARKDLVRGLPRLKVEKDHLCSACQLGKSKKHTHKPKTENTNLEVLNTLHMDLCGPMRVQTINGKKYILVIVDDYSRFTWVKFLRSKDETPEVIIKFITQIQLGLNKTVRYIRTDNGTEFVNHTLTEYYERIGIFHQKTVPKTPQQNGVVERRNRTLVEAARTMLIFSKAPMFLWAEAVATAEDLGKLQPTANTGIFVGYAPSRKGYRIYNKRT